jgi:pimeloyl-ACP methyl ester carboxylesterase
MAAPSLRPEATADATPLPPPEAVYIGDRPRFAWLHRPATAATTALVIVPPFGYEAVCAHRALRHLAQAAARAGLFAIRVDLDGTGDSAGDDLDPGRLDAWLAAIDAACDAAEADRIVIAGVRLGATLAALAAARRGDIAGVVAIAPLPVGRAWLREARALEATLDLAPPPPGVAKDDHSELVGFALTAETRDAIGRIDLVAATAAPAPAVLVVDRDDLPPSDRWVARLRELGTAVDHRRLPGYVDMVLDPHKTCVPHVIVDAAIDFASRAPPVRRAARPAVVHTRAELAGVAERPVWLDDRLFAIATEPRAPAHRAVILLNAGAVGRIGPNRLYVAVARKLAARGDLVLRVDLSGLGDSPPRPGAVENIVYGDHAVDDVELAVGWARRAGAREVAVVGLCSGAYHALEAACAGQPIDTVVAINPLTFHYTPGLPLDFTAFRVTLDTERWTRSTLSLASWRKVLRGEVDVRRIASVVALRIRDRVEHRARDVLRRLRVRLRDDLGSDLLALGRRGVAIRFIFAGDDPGRAMLVEQGGSAVTRLAAAGRLAIRVIDGADHTFTPRWSHPLLLDAIAEATR